MILVYYLMKIYFIESQEHSIRVILSIFSSCLYLMHGGVVHRTLFEDANCAGQLFSQPSAPFLTQLCSVSQESNFSQLDNNPIYIFSMQMPMSICFPNFTFTVHSFSLIAKNCQHSSLFYFTCICSYAVDLFVHQLIWFMRLLMS